jgi:hypothetical protein
MDCRIKSGNDDVRNRSRGAFLFAPESCPSQSKQKAASEPDLRQIKPVVVTGFVKIKS